MAALLSGYNVIIQQKSGTNNVPIYPITRTKNVFDTTGNDLDTIIAGLAVADHGYHVPTPEETANNLRFLRNDNSWATIQSASTSAPGVVQLSDSTNTQSSTVAATAKAVATVQAAVNAMDSDIEATYVKLAQLGVATSGGVVGVATLDTSGLVPSSQLPSYVDDVIEVKMAANLQSAELADGTPVTPESGKIYVDCVGQTPSNKTYRWSGTAYVVISETLALGETSSTAYRGDRGAVAYTHSQVAHARVDATKTEQSEDNGYIKIDGQNVLVYTHPAVDGATTTNPHGTTKSDVGLGNVENKDSATIRSEITSANVTAALGYTPQNAATLATAANNGVMSSTYAAKVDGCMETAVASVEPTFASGSGIWYQIVSTDTE